MLSERQSSESSLWWVPLTFTCDFSEIYTGWMFGDEEGMELDINTTSEQWIIFNVNQVGGSYVSCRCLRAVQFIRLETKSCRISYGKLTVKYDRT